MPGTILGIGPRHGVHRDTHLRMADQRPNRRSDLPYAKIVRIRKAAGASSDRTSSPPSQSGRVYAHSNSTWSSVPQSLATSLAPPAESQLEVVRLQLKNIDRLATLALVARFAPLVIGLACLIPPATPIGLIILFFCYIFMDKKGHTSDHNLLKQYFEVSDAHLAAAVAGSPITQYEQLIKVRNLLLAHPAIGDAAKERWRSNYVLYLAQSVLHASIQRSHGQIPPPEMMLRSFLDAAASVQMGGQGRFLRQEDLTAVFYALRDFYIRLPRAMQSQVLPVADLAAAIMPSLRPGPIYCDSNRSPNLDLGLYLDLIFNFAMAYESQDNFLDSARLLMATQTLQQMASLPSLAGSLFRLKRPRAYEGCSAQIKQALLFSHAQMVSWIYTYQPQNDNSS